MKRSLLLLTALTVVAFSGCGMHACKMHSEQERKSCDKGHAEHKGKQQHNAKEGSKPFLILGKMPHMTKMVQMHWDDAKLALTADQKVILLKVRQETMSQAQAVGKEVNALEDEVALAIKTGATPDSLKAKVDQIASLKAKATQIHLTCIYTTQNTLSKEQLTYLMSQK